jgi:hypothetical protein
MTFLPTATVYHKVKPLVTQSQATAQVQYQHASVVKPS